MDTINFQELINLSQNWTVKLDWSLAHHAIKGLRLGGKAYPVSITEVEANYIKDHIIEKGYKKGFELATGVGISSLAIGLGMKQTGGRLITCDTFTEEQIQKVPFGPQNPWDAYPDGHRMFQSLKSHFNLPVDFLGIGSPEVYGKLESGLDFVFLDCPKDDADLRRDIDGIFPLLADKFSIILHDTHCFTGDGERYFQQVFGRLYDKVYEFGPVKQEFPLAVFVKE